MKRLTLVTLLVFAAPFGWGEDEDVWYCVDEFFQETSVGTFSEKAETTTYPIRKFSFKYDAGERQVVFAGEITLTLDCSMHCYKETSTYATGNANTNFHFREGRYFLSKTAWYGNQLSSGTCTKF